MKGVTVVPGDPGSLDLTDVAETARDGTLLVETVAVGICGTDREIIQAGYGTAPAGEERLVLGHESLARVVEAPARSSIAEGEMVAGIVRQPDPEPCDCCAAGRPDMCLNGRYREHGIKELHGFARERFSLDTDAAVRVDASLDLAGVLLEPTSVVVKAWRKALALAALNCLEPRRVLVTGAGPIGLLAALVATQDGLDVHVVDRVERGLKPELARRLGASYHTDAAAAPEPDVILECTGSAALAFEVTARTRRNAVVGLLSVSGSAVEEIDVGALNRELVLENDIVFGSVNASRTDYEAAVDRLVEADRTWLDDVLARRVPLGRWREAYEERDDDVKTVLVFRDG